MANDKLSNFDVEVGPLLGPELMEFTQDAITKVGTPQDLADFANIPVLLIANNLNDVDNEETSLANIGGLSIVEGMAKAANLSDVASTTQSLLNLGGLAVASNLSDVANAEVSLDNLGGLSILDGLAKAANLTDVADPAASLLNLGGIPQEAAMSRNANLADVDNFVIALLNLNGLASNRNLLDVANPSAGLANLGGLALTGGTMTGEFKITDKSFADLATPGVGEYWVRDDNPNTPMFTDDVGQDYILNEEGNIGDMLSANNLSDVDNFIVALNNIDGLARSGGTMDGTFKIIEKASAAPPQAGIGEYWVRGDIPSTPMFTDDVGQDFVLNDSGGGSGDMLGANNLSDVDNANISLQNINGLNQALNLSDVSNAATSLANLGGLSISAGLQSILNLSDVQNSVTSLSNLGGLRATSNLADVASATVSLANLGGLSIAAGLQSVANLGDVSNSVTSLNNINGLSRAGGTMTGTLAITPGILELGQWSATGASQGSRTIDNGSTWETSATTANFANHYKFWNTNGQVGYISTTGTGTTFSTASDYRLKENDVSITYGRENIMALRPINFNFKADPTLTVEGFFAHEVAEICPQAVTGAKDAVDGDGNPIHQGIDTSYLVALLVAGLQDAFREIDELRNG